MFMFEDSIESNHVLPILAPKIASINKLTGFDGDIEDALGKAISRGTIASQKPTSIEVTSEELVDDDTDDDDDDDGEEGE